MMCWLSPWLLQGCSPGHPETGLTEVCVPWAAGLLVWTSVQAPVLIPSSLVSLRDRTVLSIERLSHERS